MLFVPINLVQAGRGLTLHPCSLCSSYEKVDLAILWSTSTPSCVVPSGRSSLPLIVEDPAPLSQN